MAVNGEPEEGEADVAVGEAAEVLADDDLHLIPETLHLRRHKVRPQDGELGVLPPEQVDAAALVGLHV